MSNISELGQLIDCTEEEFHKFCMDKDLGYISSFHNLMVQTYNEVLSVKNDFVEKMCKSSEKSEEEQKILNGLYSKLLRIEQRVFILREIIKNRQITH